MADDVCSDGMAMAVESIQALSLVLSHRMQTTTVGQATGGARKSAP